MISLFYRQVEPSEDNVVASSLNKNVQMRNARRLKVNAQVTFVIYVLETVGNCSIALFWIFINQTTTNMTMTLSLFWFHVMLPYVFLMNTSHNKKLVIDDGWLTTIHNTLVLSENFSTMHLRLLTKMRRDQVKRNQIDDSTNPRSKSEETVSNTPSRCDSDIGSKVNGDIYVISKSITSTPLSEKESIQSIKVLSEMPSNSRSVAKIKHKEQDTCYEEARFKVR